MTAAQELRAAAARLREKAKNTTAGPWAAVQGVEICPRWIISEGATEKDSAYAAEVARSYAEDGVAVSDADWEWMAFASPLLAEPLAAWLESWDGIEIREDAPMVDDLRHALNVARAILRSGS